jgi:rhomboid protease GluP
MPLTDESARVRATAFVLQRYHLSDLAEAEQKLTPRQFQGVLREIDEVQASLVAQTTPARPVAEVPGIDTPLGRVPPVTALLLGAIWAVFALESLQPGGSTNQVVLFTFGAVASDTLSSGQYWRLLATCFLHIGFFHIVSNSIALLWLGSLAERLYGPLRYLAIYLAAGIGGSIVAVLTSSPDQLSAGASGAIMGVLGAMLAGSWRNRRITGAAASRQLFSGLATVLVVNLVIGFTVPNISNAAHLGGAAAGALLALLIPYRSPRYPRRDAITANVLCAVLIVAALALGATALLPQFWR